MIEAIKSNTALLPFIDDNCCENEVGVSFDERISPDDYVIIKVDQYYNSLNIERRPASIDCLIVRQCVEEGFGLSLVELKDITSGRGFTIANIKEKFQTTLDDFISTKFDLLDIDYSNIQLFFVTKQEIYKRDLGLKMEVLINTRFNFRGRKLMITPRMPTPTIKPCY